MRENGLKKYIPLLLCISCLFLSGCGKSERSIADVQKSGAVKVGVAVNEEYPEKQRYLSAEEQNLIDRFCQAVSVTAEYAFYQPQELEKVLADGKADLAIGALTKSEWKDREEIWNSEVYEQKFLFTITRRGDYLSSVKSLSGKNVGVSERIGEMEMQQFYVADDITLVPYGTLEHAQQDLKKNVISAYICFQDQAEESAEDKELQIQDLANTTPEARVVLVKAGNDEILTQINSLIQEIRQE